MFVKDYMTRHPVLVEPEMSIVEAQGIMAEAQVRHVPVVESGKRLAGLITRQRLHIPPTQLASLNVWEITRFLSHLAVRDVMVKRKDVITIGPAVTLEDAALVMVKNKIGCLPVLEDDIVVGIITEIDMLVQLVNLLGGGVPGVRVTIRMPNKKGELAQVTSAIASKGWGIWASGGVPTPRQPDYWDMVVKVRDAPKAELVAALEKIEGQAIVDVREIEGEG